MFPAFKTVMVPDFSVPPLLQPPPPQQVIIDRRRERRKRLSTSYRKKRKRDLTLQRTNAWWKKIKDEARRRREGLVNVKPEPQAFPHMYGTNVGSKTPFPMPKFNPPTPVNSPGVAPSRTIAAYTKALNEGRPWGKMRKTYADVSPQPAPFPVTPEEVTELYESPLYESSGSPFVPYQIPMAIGPTPPRLERTVAFDVAGSPMFLPAPNEVIPETPMGLPTAAARTQSSQFFNGDAYDIVFKKQRKQ